MPGREAIARKPKLDGGGSDAESEGVSAPNERLANESNRAFAAFIEYLRLGPQRSLDAAAQSLHKSVGTLRKWSERHGWVARAAAYDELCIRQELELQAVLTKSKAVDWVRRQERLKEAEWEIAERCIEKAKELLARPDVKWSGGDIAKLLDVASKLARLSTGMETDRRELTGKDGGPVKVEVDVTPLIRRVYGAEVPPPNGPVIDIQSSEGARQVQHAGRGESLGDGTETEKKPGHLDVPDTSACVQ